MPDVNALFRLDGKSALVTGGSRGLGAEIAEGLAEAGAGVFLLARREQWLAPTLERFRDRGLPCEGTVCDVTKPAEVEQSVAAAIRSFGKLDILVNNAGVTWGAKAEEMPLEKWRAVLDVNLTGAFLFTQAAGRHMLERGSGCIVNIASIAALSAAGSAGEGIVGYAASKAGLLGMTREIAARWGPRGVRLNAVAPGFFLSRMTEKVLEDVQEDYEARAALRRIGRPGEIKGVVVFLASDAASYITGQTIVVDGGATIA